LEKKGVLIKTLTRERREEREGGGGGGGRRGLPGPTTARSGGFAIAARSIVVATRSAMAACRRSGGCGHRSEEAVGRGRGPPELFRRKSVALLPSPLKEEREGEGERQTDTERERQG
jgi:hypothetical protein